MENIFEYLDALEEEIRNSKKAMLSNSRIIDESKCLELIQAIRTALPEEINEADCIVKDRNMMMEQASRQAREIIEHAEDKADRILDESEIMQRAREEADYIVAQAKEYAQKTKSKANLLVDDLLADAEDKLGSVVTYIRECREDLNGGIIKK